MSWQNYEFNDELKNLYQIYEKKFDNPCPNGYMPFVDYIYTLNDDEWAFYLKRCIKLNLPIEDYFRKYNFEKELNDYLSKRKIMSKNNL